MSRVSFMIRSVFARFQSVPSLKAGEKDVEALTLIVKYIDISQHLLIYRHVRFICCCSSITLYTHKTVKAFVLCAYKPAQGLAGRCQNNLVCCYYDFFNVDIELV